MSEAKKPFYEEGGYIGKIVSQALVKSSNKGTPQFVIQFTVMARQGGEVVTQQYNRKIYRAITAGTAEFVKEDFKKLGFTGVSVKLLDPSTPGFYDLTGKDIGVYCKYEADAESNLREKWQLSRFADGIEGEPVDDFASVDAILGLSGKVTASRPAPTPINGSSNATAMSDDDLKIAVAGFITDGGGTLAKAKLSTLLLLKAKANKASVERAKTEEFLTSGGDLWNYDGTTLTAVGVGG